jgi:hypothetical protein
MFEYDSSYRSWGVNLTETVDQLHERGIRAFAATEKFLPSVESHVELFDSEIDVVYTYHTQNAVAARDKVNKARGIYNNVFF